MSLQIHSLAVGTATPWALALPPAQAETDLAKGIPKAWTQRLQTGLRELGRRLNPQQMLQWASEQMRTQLENDPRARELRIAADPVLSPVVRAQFDLRISQLFQQLGVPMFTQRVVSEKQIEAAYWQDQAQGKGRTERQVQEAVTLGDERAVGNVALLAEALFRTGRPGPAAFRAAAAGGGWRWRCPAGEPRGAPGTAGDRAGPGLPRRRSAWCPSTLFRTPTAAPRAWWATGCFSSRATRRRP